MHPILRKKSRVAALFSLVFLSQCCCCILPVGWQVQRNPEPVRQLVQNVEELVTNFRGSVSISELIDLR